MYVLIVDIFDSDTILRLAARAPGSIRGLCHLLEAEISIVPMHLANDFHVSGIAVQQRESPFVFVALFKLRESVVH